MDDQINGLIVENCPIGYVYYKIIKDSSDKVREYKIIKSNTNYEKIRGQEKTDTLDFLSNIIKSKQTFVDYSCGEKHYQIKVSFPKKDSILLYFIDITSEIEEKEKFNLLCEDMTLQVWFLKDPTKYGFVNQLHANFIGFKKEEVLNKSIYNFLNQEEAEICAQANKEIFKQKKKITSKEWVSNSKNERRLLKISKSPKINLKGEIEFLMCIAEDITDQHKAEIRNKTKERILYSMIDFTQELLTNEDSTAALSNAIDMIGNATKVDRVYYWENHYDNEKKEWLTSQRFEWCLGGIDQQINNPVLQNIPMEGIGAMTDTLSQNKPFMTHIKDMDDATDTKQVLEAQGILSILILPVFINKEFKGYIGFDSCQIEKEWSKVEVSLLESFVLLYKKALERDILESHIRQVKINFDNFFNKVNDLLFVLDLKGNIIQINDTALDRLGYSREEIIGQSVIILNPEERSNEFDNIIDNTIRGKEMFYQNPLVTKEGKILFMEMDISEGIWSDSPVIFVNAKDISLLSISEEKFSKAFNNSGVGMFITTIDDNEIIDVNDTFLNLIGFKRKEIIGKGMLELDISLNSSIRDIVKKEILHKGQCSNIEVEIKCKDGSIVTGLCSINPVTINNEECLLSSIIDVTERKIMVEELAKAKKESDTANKAKSKFLSHISHEIRTPMNAVMGYSDLLSMSKLNEKQEAYLSGIQTSSDMLLRIINDILDWAKIDSDKLELDCLAFSVSECIASVLGQVKFRSISQHVDIISELNNVPEIVYGDPLHLQQVLLNLISNSIKFTQKGSIKVGVKTIKQDKKTVTLEFKVEDTGTGIPEDKLKYIYSPFKQIDNELGRQYGGTGLGLPICKKIVDSMNGEMWVKSTVGKGSTFFFTARFKTLACEENCGEKKECGYFKEETKVNLNGLVGTRVLVVDDNEINQDVLKEILETKNMIVTLADSGFQAIDHVENQDFDIVLMDIRMPQMDGYQASTEIRKIKSSKELPIIAVTANASPDELEKCISRGICDCITKPFEKTKLFQAMLYAMGSQIDLVDKTDKNNVKIVEKDTDIFSGLYGVDISATLKQFNGNQKFVSNILKKFNVNHKDVVEEIRQALANKDFELAERLAHTIKGVSGQISAIEIHRLSGQIEEKLKKDNTDIETLLDELEKELKNLFKHPIFEEDESEKEESIVCKKVDLLEVEPLLIKIEELLEESDMDVADYLEEIKNITMQTSIYKEILKMKEFGDRYDFENALEVLNNINIIIKKEA